MKRGRDMTHISEQSVCSQDDSGFVSIPDPECHGYSINREADRDSAGKQKQRRRRKKGIKLSSRRCHDCGRPTSDYRCRTCWRKLRGFSVEEASAHETPFAL